MVTGADVVLPVYTEDGDNAHRGKLVTDIHHGHRLAHELSEDPVPVPDQLMDCEGHPQQEQQVGDGQAQNVDVRQPLGLAGQQDVDDQAVRPHPNDAQDPVHRGQDVHQHCVVQKLPRGHIPHIRHAEVFGNVQTPIS